MRRDVLAREVLRDYVEERKRDGAEPHVTAPLDFRSR